MTTEQQRYERDHPKNPYASDPDLIPDVFGGVSLFAVMDDGGTLCEPCVRDASNPVHPADPRNSDGWGVLAFDTTGNTDDDVICDHCGRILQYGYDHTFQTDAECTAYLLSTGSGRVPCSRYGHDTESCAPVAVRFAMLVSDATGEPITAETLDYAMGLVVNDHFDVVYTLTEHGGTAADYELAAYECLICGAPHPEDAHGEPLVMRDTNRDTVTGLVYTFMDEASALLHELPPPSYPFADRVPTWVLTSRLATLRNAWDAHTDDERDEYATEYLDDLDAILSDAGFLPVTDGDQGTWSVYAATPHASPYRATCGSWAPHGGHILRYPLTVDGPLGPTTTPFCGGNRSVPVTEVRG